MPAPTDKPIIFFDGFCGLCSDFVDFVMKIDPAGKHMFSPLQGETAKELLNKNEREDLDSVVIFQNGRKLYRSQAVLQVFKNIGGLWALIAFFSFIPVFISDFVYRIVAKYRYKVFGKKESCRLPTPPERKRFLP